MADRSTNGAGNEPEPKVRVLPPDPVPGRWGPSPPPPPLQGPGRRSSRVLLVGAAMVVVLGAGIYGYRLGAEDPMATSNTESAAATPVAPPSVVTAPPTTVAGAGFEQTVTEFVRRNPGHEVPEDVTEYLDRNEVAALAIDPDGQLWSAGPGGVVRWSPEDGSSIPLTTSDGRGPVGARGLAIAPNGDVWVTTNDGLARWNGTEWVASGAPRSSNRMIEQSTLAVTRDGSVWVASVEWPSESSWEEPPQFRIHRSRGDFVGDIETYIAPTWVGRLAAAPDGSLWALIEGEVWRFDNERWELVVEPSYREITHLAVDTDGSVLLAGENRVRRWSNGGITEVTALDDGWVASVDVDANGVGWALAMTWSETDGERAELVRLDDQSRHPVPHVDHFTEAMAVAGDTVWIGGDGVSGFDGAGWSHLRVEDDPPLGWGDHIAVDQGGTLWLGSDKGIVTFDGTSWTGMARRDVGLPESDADQWMWGGPETWVAGGAGDALWVGFGCAVAVREDGAWTALDPPPNLGDSEWCWPGPRSVAPDGSLWMGIEGVLGHRVLHADASGWSDVVQAPGQMLSALTVAPEGTVWIAGEGIFRLDGDEWTTVLGGIEIETLTVAGDGSVWAAEPCWDCPTDHGRLWRLEDGVWTAEDSNIHAHRLDTAPDGTVWAMGERDRTSPGLWRHDARGVFRRVLGGGDLNTYAFAPDGSVWAAAEGRVLHIER